MSEGSMPRYRIIIDNIKERITIGTLAPGERLPTVREIAATWKVSHATATKAMRELCRDGYAYVSGNATYVRDRHPGEITMRVPVVGGKRPRAAGGTFTSSGWTIVTEAGVVTPPDYVCDVMGLERGTEVLRREVVDRGKASPDGSLADGNLKPVVLAVHWHPASFAEVLPALLLTGVVDSTSPLKYGAVGGPYVEYLLGREPRLGLDSFHARQADEREARLLEIAEGDTILARVVTFADEQGVTEYMEACYPVGVVISFEHQDGEDPADGEPGA